MYEIQWAGDFPGGPAVKNPPWNARDAGSIPGRGPKIPHATEQASLSAVAEDPTWRSEDPTQLNKQILKKKKEIQWAVIQNISSDLYVWIVFCQFELGPCSCHHESWS